MCIVAETIAVLSDTHDNLKRVERAREILESRGVRRAIHCGDITTSEVVRALADLEVHWVFGNCDFSRGPLELAMRRAGHRCPGLRGELEVEGRRLAFTHGDRPGLVRALLSGGFDLVLLGHTDLRRDHIVDGARILCPGALHRAVPPGFALLHLPALTVEWVEL